jgi:hypothetical protein
MGIPRAPEGAGPGGRRLWSAVLGRYALDPHELELLRRAVRLADVCDQLERKLAVHGPLLDDGRVRPAAVELRLQSLALARVIVALRLPEEAPARPTRNATRAQRRGMRGVYAVGGPP